MSQLLHSSRITASASHGCLSATTGQRPAARTLTSSRHLTWRPRAVVPRHVPGGSSGTLTNQNSRSAKPSPVAARAAAVAQVLDQAVSSQASIEDIMVQYSQAFTNSQHVEHSYWVDDTMVEGELPKDLQGTLLRNGPGLFEVGGNKIAQPFDGDGMVAAFAFKDGKVHFSNKFVRTKGFVEEQRAGKQLYRSAFNVGAPEGQRFWNPFAIDVKNTSNTNVLHWGGRTLAFSEAGRPYELDTELNTIRETDLGGLLPTEKERCHAHFRVVSVPGAGERLVAYGTRSKGNDAEFDIWEFDQQLQLVHKNSFTLPGGAWGFYHDIAVTPHYYIVMENPITFDTTTFATRYLWGKACIAECLKFDASKKTRIHLLPRPGAGALLRQTVEVDGPPVFVFHHANAFEAGFGKQVVLDSFAAQYVDLGMSKPSIDYYYDHRRKNRLTRFVIDTDTGKVASHTLYPRSSEMPCILPGQGHPMRHMYCQTEIFDDSVPHFGPPQALAKLTLADPTTGASAPFDPASITATTWLPGPGKIAQEPVYVPRPSASAEDDGWLLTLVYDVSANTTSLAILDAQDVGAGPVCSIHLPHHLPLGLHGHFTPGAFLGLAPEGRADPAPHDIRNGV